MNKTNVQRNKTLKFETNTEIRKEKKETKQMILCPVVDQRGTEQVITDKLPIMRPNHVFLFSANVVMAKLL